MSRLFCTFLLTFAAVPLLAGSDAADPDPSKVAGAYLSAMEARDLDRAEALFAVESSIFESGGEEGDWKNYRGHHLGPEVDAVEEFAIDRRKGPAVTTSADKTLAVVTWPIEYRIALKDERVINSRGTVTFVLSLEDASYRIRHLHWSSRRSNAGH